MANLTKLKEFTTPGKRLNFKAAAKKAGSLRNTPYRARTSSITQSYLGFDVVAQLDNANESSNAGLLAELSKLESKTDDMQVAGEALRRKATQLAVQTEIRTETVTHVLKEAERLGKAHNTENSAVIDFLKNMAIANQRSDNKDAYSGLSGEQSFREEQASFSERVRNLFVNAEQKAIAANQAIVDNQKASDLAERLRLMKQKQALLNNWAAGNSTTEDIIDPYKELVQLRATKEQNGQGKGSIFSAIGGFFNKAVG